MSPAGTIAVCVATYLRPAGLARLLQGLERQDLGDDAARSLEIIVVDNDPAGSARELCAEASRKNRWPIVYVHEPRRGIPFARNAGVRCALDRGAALLAFVDDDEVPDESWLQELMLTLTRHTADVVTGPVLPHFEGEVPRWVLSGRFFAGRSLPTGTRLDRAYTNNVLVAAEVFSRVEALFDERLLVMGEDTDFFLRANAAGCTIVWASKAIVRAWISEQRTRARWLIRRAYRRGIAGGQLRVGQAKQRRAALRGLVVGGVWLPWSLLGGRAALVRALRLIATGAGYLASKARARSLSQPRR